MTYSVVLLINMFSQVCRISKSHATSASEKSCTPSANTCLVFLISLVTALLIH